MADRLEELRHELADVEAALEGCDDAARGGLQTRRTGLQTEILQLERAAREEAGAQPVADAEGTAEEIAESRPSATELVVPSLPPGAERRTETVLVLDRHDEDQILNALEERMDKVLLYDFEQDGKKLVDLSYNGVLECVRQINQTQHARLRILPGSLEVVLVDLADKGPHYEATVAAEDMLTGMVTYGTATEPQFAFRRSSADVFDKFARTKAINKAQRNALKMHIPERLRQGIIALYKGDAQRVLEVKHGAGAAAAAQLPPPLATEEMQALEETVRGMWVEIRKLPRWQELMLPGVWNAKFSRARSSVPAMEAFIEENESLRAKVVELNAG